MSMLSDFKKFIARGNVVDLAVGVVIGAAFGKIVTSFVGDIVMPPIGLALGKVDFTSLFISLDGKPYPSVAAAKAAGAPVIAYGIFVNTIIEFLIVAAAVFMLVKLAMRLHPKAPEPVTTKDCPMCASKIPLAAKRCPECTSMLDAAATPAE